MAVQTPARPRSPRSQYFLAVFFNCVGHNGLIEIGTTCSLGLSLTVG